MTELARASEIVAAWKRIKPHFQPHQTDVPDFENPVQLIEENLRPFFAMLWGADKSQFEIPQDFQYFLAFSSKGWKCDKGLGFYFYTPEAIIISTKRDYRTYEDDELPTLQNTWIEIAHWSDRHYVFLCCDPNDTKFGTVIDCHDGDPYHSPEACGQRSPNFLSYLSKLVF